VQPFHQDVEQKNERVGYSQAGQVDAEAENNRR